VQNISKIQKDKKNLIVQWSDGEESLFNYFWLRDNCPTAHDKDSNHRMFNILEVSENLEARRFQIN
jgi:gamma-butyrobetaine dioxygenase